VLDAAKTRRQLSDEALDPTDAGTDIMFEQDDVDSTTDISRVSSRDPRDTRSASMAGCHCLAASLTHVDDPAGLAFGHERTQVFQRGDALERGAPINRSR
jgi:hypothetical protein